MADKFEDLRTYVTVVSCGGINAAAAELGIAKSAVSRRISDLEGRLGTTLIERSTRRFEVTAIGHSYFATASDLLSKLEALDADPSALKVPGTASVAAAPVIARHVLAAAIAGFLAERPGISVELVDADEPADISVAIGDGPHGRILVNTVPVLCAATSYLETNGGPDRTADLPDHTGVMLHDQGGAWKLAGGATRSPRTAVTATDPDVALALVHAGAGIAQLPDFVVHEAIATGAIVALLVADAPPSDHVIATLATQAGPLAKALVDHLAESLAGRR